MFIVEQDPRSAMWLVPEIHGSVLGFQELGVNWLSPPDPQVGYDLKFYFRDNFETDHPLTT